MEKLNLTTILSALSNLVTIPGSIYTISENYPKNLTVLFVIAAVASIVVFLFAMGWVGKKSIADASIEETSKSLNPTLEVLGNLNFQDDWEIERQTQYIDLKDDGKIAHCETIVSLKSKRDSNQMYYFTSSPNDGVEINLSNGKLTSSNKADGAFSEVRLDAPVNRNAPPFELTISFQLKNTFTKSNEWWLHRKIYRGGIYHLQISFPSEKPIKGFTCNVYDNEFLNPPVALNGKKEYIFKDGRPVIDVECTLSINQRLLVEWTW